MSCLEAKTGNEIWKGRINGNHWASPVYAAEKIYFFNQDGKISVISAGREFELLAENELNASFIASPAVVGEAMILRSKTHLYHLANGFKRVIPKDETSRETEGKLAKGNPKKSGKRKNDGSGKEKSEKSQVTVQQEVKGWTSYFRTASAQQIRQAIEREKFQLLPDDAKQKIKMAAEKFLSQKDK